MMFVLVLCCSTPVHAEEKSVNLELTAYLPGFGVEYQWDESKTLGINYTAAQNFNVHLTHYNDGVFEGGFYQNGFIGYDDGRKNGLISEGAFVYVGAVSGYQWMWDNGVNVNLDGGLMLLLFPSNKDAYVLPLPAFAISVGYAFSLGE